MVRDELQIHGGTCAHDNDAWLRSCCRLLLRTHNYVVEKLSQPGMYESLLLFCAKALAINFFCIPKLACVSVAACRKTFCSAWLRRLLCAQCRVQRQLLGDGVAGLARCDVMRACVLTIARAALARRC